MRPCLDCGAPTAGTRCQRDQQAHDARRWEAKSARYRSGPDGAAWAELSRQARAEHVALYGGWCLGWGVAPHEVEPHKLVTDHDLGVMCTGCNGRKAATHDKTRRSS